MIVLKKKKIFFPELKNLILNALLSGICDENIRVKRYSLDLIKIAFPLSENLLKYEEKLILMKTILIDLNSRDSSLCRRLWE